MHLPDFLKEDWMKQVEIRLALPEEVPEILDIIHEAYKPIESILGRKPRGLLETTEGLSKRIESQSLYAVLFDGGLVGTFTIAYNTRYEAMEVQKIAIKKERQNKGLGSYVMESCEQLVRLMEERKIVVETYEEHEQLVKFYLHRNYKISSRRMSKGNPVVCMEKQLWRED